MKVVKKIADAYYRALGYYPITINHSKFKLDPYHTKFWARAAKGRWEPHTFKILETFLNTDSVYCDVGAWIGPTVIYAAKKCRKVICFEPDPVAYRYLCWNIELNELDNVIPFNIALADDTAIQRMSSFGDGPGDSMTSLLNEDREKKGVFVLTLTWEAFNKLFKTEKVDFLKIDIEGSEFALLPTLKGYLSSHKPIVYLSTHAPFLDARSRREKLRQIIDVMGIYKKCLDEHLRPINIRELEGEDAMNNFCSYIFTD